MTYFRDYRKAEFRPPVSDEIRKALIQRLPAMAYFPNLASAPDGIALIYNLQNLRTEILGWDFTSAAVSQAIVSLTKDIELLQKEIRKARDLRGGGVVELKRKYPSRYLLNDNSLNVIPEQTLFNDCRQGQRLRELLWLLLPLMPNVNHFPPVR